MSLSFIIECLEYGKKFQKPKTPKGGRAKRAENAIGGVNASPLEFPHMVSLNRVCT